MPYTAPVLLTTFFSYILRKITNRRWEEEPRKENWGEVHATYIIDPNKRCRRDHGYLSAPACTDLWAGSLSLLFYSIYFFGNNILELCKDKKEEYIME